MKLLLKSYRGPSYRYKIRKLTTNNKSGDSYGINIPKPIVTLFEGVAFNIFIAGSNIILASGTSTGMDKKGTSYQYDIFG